MRAFVARIPARAAAVLTVAVFALSALVPARAMEDHGHATHDVVGNPTPVEIREGSLEYLGGSAFTGGHVAREGDRLYVGAYGLGMRIFDISDPAAPREIGAYLPGVRADVPPDAAVFDGRHIAVLNGTRRTHSLLPDDGRTDRTEFLDVTDPANPRVLWTFGPDQIDGESHNGDIVDARRLYLPSGGVGVQGLRIYDLTPLLGDPPAAPAILFRGDPVALWEASPFREGRAVGAAYTHTHDIEVYVDHPVRQPDGSLARRDIALLAEGGSYLNNNGNTGSAFVIDITDPRAPVVLYRWLHERGEDHHPIRYHHEAQLLAGDPSVMLVTDEDLHNGCGGAGGTTAIRLNDTLTSGVELSEWFIPASTPAPVCSVHVFSSHDDLVFIGSYNAGLQVVDYSDPANPRQVAFSIQPGSTAWGALYHQGYVYVGDMSRGLDVYRYPLPDLAISSADVAATRQHDGSVLIRATVRNVGTAEASDVVVDFLDEGERFAGGSVPRLGPGESATFEATLKPKGKRTVTVVADPNGAITELREDNNSASINVSPKR
ncbi:MAG: hypothetical protein M3N29_00260 [Chloroflexota bacterium]|nr:hypothetical protein [Chloroflexota bacterium]